MSQTYRNPAEFRQVQQQRAEQVDLKIDLHQQQQSANADAEKALGQRINDLEQQVASGTKRSELSHDYEAVDAELESLSEKKQQLYKSRQDNKEEAKKHAINDKFGHQAQAMVYEDEITELEKQADQSDAELAELNDEYHQLDKDKNPEQAAQLEQKLNAQEQKATDNQSALEAKKAQAEKSQQIANEQSAENAQRVEQACPNKCTANKMLLRTNNQNRKVELSLTSGGKVLEVISVSSSASERTHKLWNGSEYVPSGLRVIEAELEGECQKGKTNVSTLSAQANLHERDGSAENCPVMTIKQDETHIILPGTESAPLKFNVYCPEQKAQYLSILNFFQLFQRVFWASKAEPIYRGYTLQAQSCEGSAPFSVEVHAYPKIKAEVSLSVQYVPRKTEDIVADYKDTSTKLLSSAAEMEEGHKKISLSNWQFEGQLKGHIDSYDFAPAIKNIDLSEMFTGLRESIEVFVRFYEIILAVTCRDLSGGTLETAAADSAGSHDVQIGIDKARPATFETDSDGNITKKESKSKIGSISLRYPKLAFAISAENTETTESTTLDYTWSAALKADPLIGISANVDILAALLNIAANALLPGAKQYIEAGKRFADFIGEIVKKADYLALSEAERKEQLKDKAFYIDAGIGLQMEVGANLGCAGQWKKDFGKKDPQVEPNPDKQGSSSDVTGGANVTMDILLEGKLYAKTHLEAFSWTIEYEAGMYIAIGSAKEVGAAKVEFKFEAGLIGGKPEIIGGVEWSGLAIISAVYTKKSAERIINNRSNRNAKGGGLGGEPGEPPQSTSQERPNSGTTLDELQHDFDNKWVIIEEGKYPKDPKVTLDEYAKL